MKKVLALVMCIAMIASFAVTASAATDVTFTVADVKDAKVGETYPVDIAISAESNIGALEFYVALDGAYLEPGTTKNKKGQDVYYVNGDATTAAGASLVGSDGFEAESGKYKFAAAAADGYWDAGVIVTIYVKVIAELPEEGAAITLEVGTPVDCEDKTVEFNVTTDDAVVLPYVEPVPESPADPQPPVIVDPESPEKPTKPGVDDGKGEDNKGEDDETKIPATGDASAIAVAAGLCAVMAAAFVLTKKVND